MTAVFDCGDFYFYGNHQKYQVEAVLVDELGLENITVREITWEEHDRQEALAKEFDELDSLKTGKL